MEKIKALGSEDIVANNIERLKELFPTIFSEGKFVVEELQALLGDYVEKDKEFYQMTWAGKTQAQKEANKISTGTLRPNKVDSKDWDTTGNIFIEGDNLEVLKLLQKTYSNKIKMIYIDPPYNTGKDFVYKDNYKDNLSNYLEITGQTDEDRKKLSTNTDSDGRYHSNWLNMMYPRLKLARNLMTDDGVIFISIDDDEQANLKKLCDEIFGEENFVAKLVHKNNSNKNQSKLIGVSTEFVFLYCKSKISLKEVIWRVEKKGANEINKIFKTLKSQGLSLEEISNEIKLLYQRPKFAHLSRWNKVNETGIFKDADLSREGGPKNYTIINPNTNLPCVIPDRGWGKSYEELLRLQQEGLIWYGDDRTPPGQIDYIEDENMSVPDSFMYYDNSIDTKWQKRVFNKIIFENPKPLDMIKYFLELVQYKNQIILDFFSGSGTTAHAIMALNAHDGGNRKCISVQLPEPTDEKSEANKAGYKTIADITKERIRRAGELIKQENKDKEGIDKLDIGFRAFKLDSSNIQAWDTSVDKFEDQLDLFLENNGDSIKAGRTEEDVLFEILLKYGLDLTLPIQEREVDGCTIYNIGFGAMYICLSGNINISVAVTIGEWHKDSSDSKPSVIFKDAGFANDADKTNTIQTLRQAGIENVKSI